MNDQPTSPNIPASTERPAGVSPEDLQVGAAAAETAPGPGAGAPAASAPPPPKLSAADVAAAIAATPTPVAVPSTMPTPSMAADVDVIEPEWVDKAEEVVRQHHGDPYGEEEAIEVLQEDYLGKRYGINVADPNRTADPNQAATPSKPDTKPKGA